jgi:hypothetical protein
MPDDTTPHTRTWNSRLRIGVATLVVVAAATTGGLALAGGFTTQQTPTPTQTNAEELIGVEPVRVLDTRGPNNGPIGVPAARPITSGETINVAVAGVKGIPADATSVAANITIDEDATLKSFVTVWPTGSPQPFTSANNAEPGLVSPNLSFVKLGATGGVSFYAQAGAINLAVDLVGYTVPVGDAPGTGLLLTGSGAPANDRGSDGSFYLDADTGLLYGPKANGVWPGPSPVPTESSPEAVSQGVDDSTLTMATGTDNGAFDFGPPVTVASVNGLTTAGDYELDAAVEVRPSDVGINIDTTIQCWWSTRPARIFQVTLPLSLGPNNLDELAGTVSVPGSIENGTTADLICRTGSLEVFPVGGVIEIQSVQVNAHRVNLLANS